MIAMQHRDTKDRGALPSENASSQSLPEHQGPRRVLILGAAILLVAAMVVAALTYQQHARTRHPPAGSEPVLQVLNRPFENSLRQRIEAPLMHAELKIAEVIARFLDPNVKLADRRHYAYRLARDGSPEALAALRKVLASASAEDRAFLAQLIGSSGNPAVAEMLLPLLADEDDRTVMGAIRGLSAIGGREIADRIAGILADGERGDSIRIEAALALGNIGTTEARAALVATFGQDASDEVAAQILNSLGRFDFTTVAETFGEYLSAPETPVEKRVVAAEALAHSTPKAVPFLYELAKTDTDAEVRAAAAWAISAHENVREFGSALADLAEKEPEVDVRRRLYEAMLPQSAIPAERLLPLVQSEKDIAARVAGLNAIGRATAQQPTSTIAATFDREMVPELMRIATAPNSLNIQMRAVFALRRAQTPAARAALAEIAKSAPPQVARAAQNGLRATNS